MESYFLAQLIGLYMLVVGVVVTLRRCSLMPAVAELVKNKGVLILLGFVELAAGIALVLTYPRITLDWMGIISLVGWMMVIESLVYLTMPIGRVQRTIRVFNRPAWYVGGGLISIVLGAYLVAIGFGII